MSQIDKLRGDDVTDHAQAGEEHHDDEQGGRDCAADPTAPVGWRAA